MLLPKVLPVNSICNPRDLGGYIGLNGRKIRSQRLLRTGKISDINEKDRKFLLNYGLKKVIDLRSSKECVKDPDPKIDGVDYFSLPLSFVDNEKDNNFSIENKRYQEDQYFAFTKMCERYREYLETKRAQHSFYEILDLLANTKKGAILYHCSEGKDRTGLVSLIVLYLLGVDLEVIRQDYLYSNFLLSDYRLKRDKQFKEQGKNLKFRANMRIRGSVANAFFDTAMITIDEEFGGLTKYLKDQVGVTQDLRDALCDLYLEK